MRVHVEWINKKLVSPYLEPGDEGKNKQLGWDGHSEVRSPIINTLSPICLCQHQLGSGESKSNLLYHTDPGLVYSKLWHLEAQAAVASRQKSLGYL